MQKHTVFGILATIWLLILLLLTRHAMLDDSLIHLRYAGFLHRVHFITYDGTHPSFGTSSLLYVSLLAFLRGFTASPMLAKCVSVCSYLALLLLLFRQFLRLPPGSIGRWLMGILFLPLLSAMGVRWLSDGMETSLVLLFTLLLSTVLQHELEDSQTPPLRWIGLVLLGFLMTMLRIELALLIGLSCLAIFVTRSRASSPWKNLLPAAATSIGTVAALAAIYLHFHSILPDTALAKSGGHLSLVPIPTAASVLASSFVFGIGISLLWVASAIAVLVVWRSHPSQRHSLLLWAICNSSFPLLILLSCVRSQNIQGIRYLLWAFFFSILWNIFQLRDVELASQRTLRTRLIALLVILLLGMPVDAYFGLKTTIQRGNSYVAMRDAGLERFHDQIILASDVGFISYFTQGNTCDIAGLVNGRAAAALTTGQRILNCMSQQPRMLFTTISQTRAVNREVPIGSWTVCHIFDFMNVLTSDRHYVIVKDPAECGSLGIIGLVSQVLPTAEPPHK